MDVRDQDAVREAWRATEAAGGTIELLVHAAGVMSDDWDVCMAVNAGGVRNTLDVATSAMIDRGTAGSIVVLSSNAAAIPRTAMAEYAASKAAATSYTRSVGLAVAGHGIRVNVLCPGNIETDMHGDFVERGFADALLKRIPQRRFGQSEDLAGAALLLASDAGRYITGAVLAVDGGQLVHTL